MERNSDRLGVGASESEPSREIGISIKSVGTVRCRPRTWSACQEMEQWICETGWHADPTIRFAVLACEGKLDSVTIKRINE